MGHPQDRPQHYEGRITDVASIQSLSFFKALSVDYQLDFGSLLFLVRESSRGDSDMDYFSH